MNHSDLMKLPLQERQRILRKMNAEYAEKQEELLKNPPLVNRVADTWPLAKMDLQKILKKDSTNG